MRKPLSPKSFIKKLAEYKDLCMEFKNEAWVASEMGGAVSVAAEKRLPILSSQIHQLGRRLINEYMLVVAENKRFKELIPVEIANAAHQIKEEAFK